ncbi:hypothetical protein MTO96_022893 [Rhipicephalus appendiculatus]
MQDEHTLLTEAVKIETSNNWWPAIERLQTKRTLAHVNLQKLSDELMLLKTTDDLDPDQDNCIAEIKGELEVIAKDLKQQDALIKPHVGNDDFAEEYAGVRTHQTLITCMRTRLERLHRKSLSGGERAVEFYKTHATHKDVLDSSTLDAILGSLRLELESRERVHACHAQSPHLPAMSHLPKG